MSDDGVDLTDFADAPSDADDERRESDGASEGDDTVETDGAAERDDTAESDGDTAPDTTESDTDADEESDPAVDPETVSPVTGTFASGPDERTCARCETAVRTLWHDADADGYVCADCKEW
ncbi:hypothetical protein RYH80_12595 [Halobaculum sp. MBLA0147]|uniref:DUF7573 domain-containing protein n=1 Tax=Halobaculum sp. MBLA0147 TaxID=3079934 RepID=UPI00352349E2